MTEEIITRDSAAFKELRRDIVKAIRAVDILYESAALMRSVKRGRSLELHPKSWT